MMNPFRCTGKVVSVVLFLGALSACDSGSSKSTATAVLSSRTLLVESPETTSVVRWAVSSAEAQYGIAVVAESEVKAIQGVEFQQDEATGGEIRFRYRPGSELGDGNYVDRLQVIFCTEWLSQAEAKCSRHLQGSPASLVSTYRVDEGGGSGGDPDDDSKTNAYAPEILSRLAMDHDLVDAVYSREIDALIVAASSPTNAIHIYKLGQEQAISLPLDTVPRAVSVDGSDGKVTIAVGHDGWVSVFKSRHDALATASKTLLNLSTTAVDIENSHAAVYVSPERDQWVNLHRLDIASNTETLSAGGSVSAGSRIKLHPNGKHLYVADRNISPSDLEKFDIQSPVPERLYDSPYHGEWAMCGDLWFGQSGDRIYTPCGSVFTSSMQRERDMRYAGSLDLQTYSDLPWAEQIRSLSESPGENQIAAVVGIDSFYCDDSRSNGSCSRLDVFSHDFFNPISTVIFDSFRIDGHSLLEEPQYAFYNRDGDRLFVLTALHGAPSAKLHWVEIDLAKLPDAKPRVD